jgi:hypothetical protein
VRSVLVGEDDLFVEEKAVGASLDGSSYFRPEAIERLSASRFFGAHGEVDDDEVGIVGEVGCRSKRRVGHEATLRRLGPVRNASWTGTPDLLPDAILLGKSARVGNGTVAGVKLSTCA